jgi:hypothetical protein
MFQLILFADISYKITEDRRVNGLHGSVTSRHWPSFAKVYQSRKFLPLSDISSKRILRGSLKGTSELVRRLFRRGLLLSCMKKISFAVN